MNNNVILGGIIALAAIIGVIFYATTRPESSSTVATSTPNIVVDQTPTPTPKPQQAGAPVVVTGTNTTASDTTVILTGVVTPSGAFTSYWYEYGTSHSLGNKILNQTLGSGYTAISAPGYIIGLTKDMIYFYRLVAENQYGKVVGTTYSFKTTSGTPAPVGSSPTIKTLAANGITRVTANLNGEVTPNKASTTYWFEYGKTTSLGLVTAFQSVGNGNNILPASVVLTNLAPATTYYFRVDAQNQFGTVSGSILNFKTLGPAATTTAPTAVTRNASSIATSSSILHGSVTPKGDTTAYWFEYSTDSLFNSALLRETNHMSLTAASNTTNVSANLSNLTPKATYFFRVVAQNSLGITKGDTISFKTK